MESINPEHKPTWKWLHRPIKIPKPIEIPPIKEETVDRGTQEAVPLEPPAVNALGKVAEGCGEG